MWRKEAEIFFSNASITFLTFQQDLLLQPFDSLPVLSMWLRSDGSGFSTFYCLLQANMGKLPKEDADARVHNKPRTDKQTESPCWICEYVLTATRHSAHVHSYMRTSRWCNHVVCCWFGECVLNRAEWCLWGFNDFSELVDVCCQISTSFTTGFTSALKRSLKQHTNQSPKGLTAFLLSGF